MLIVSDHGRTAGLCRVAGGGPRGPWQPYVDPADTTHYPQRHTGTFNVLYVDGHVAALRKTDLTDALFYAYLVCSPARATDANWG